MAVASSIPLIRYDLAYHGRVTQIVSATSFIAAGLAGHGDGAFQGYNVYVLKKANNTTTPPHREQVACAIYVSRTGAFTHALFTAPVAVGDEVLMLHPNIATAIAILAALDVPAVDSVINLLERDVIGNKADSAQQTVVATASLVRYVKGLITALGNPTPDTLASLAAKWGDIARSLDLILGARWDAAGDLGTDIAAIIAALAGDETTGTHAHANNLNWQTVFTLAPAGRQKVHSIWLNFVNLTQNMAYRLSYDYGGLGAYVVFDTNAAAPWTPANEDGVLIDCRFVISHGVRLELQSAVLEGAPKDIPYEVYVEDME